MPEQVRAFHQCNLGASDEPTGPSAEDVQTWAWTYMCSMHICVSIIHIEAGIHSLGICNVYVETIEASDTQWFVMRI
jgi:hypothetical protein